MSIADQQSQHDKPEQSCDIVMKGGITSGVVYPLALVALAKKYRFSNIGGTSAGAIASAAAAAGEYGRPIKDAGFDRLAKIPDEIGPNLLALFQPTPLLKPLFDIFVAGVGKQAGLSRVIAVIKAAISGYWLDALLGALPGVIVVVIALLSGSAGFVFFGLLLVLSDLSSRSSGASGEPLPSISSRPILASVRAFVSPGSSRKRSPTGWRGSSRKPPVDKSQIRRSRSAIWPSRRTTPRQSSSPW